MDLYELLGVKSSATPEEVRKAYLAMARKHHPDAGGEVEQFKLISLAGEVLCDQDKRKRYDETGQTDDSLESNPAAIVASMLEEAFLQDKVDPIRWMCNHVDATRSEHLRARSKVLANVTKMERKLERFGVANQKTKNIAASEMICRALTELIRKGNSVADMHDRQAEVGTAVLTFLNDIKCPTDLEAAMQSARASWRSGNTSFSAFTS